jgi:hypothetical protein
VDVFVAGIDELARAQLARRVTLRLGEHEEVVLPVASQEDIVLQKLRWYRLGGETSERQWGDVLGVLRARSGDLDLAYLRAQAAGAGLEDLLDRALDEAERRGEPG